MYTFRALECVVNKNQETLLANDANSVIEATKLAALTLKNTSERLAALLATSGEVDAKTIAEFPYLRDEVLALIALTSHDGKPLFDGHIDADIGLTENSVQTVRIHIPDLIGRLNQYRTNYKNVADNSMESFATRMRVTDTAVTRAEATVQGVRLNTFIPKSCTRNRLSMISSLSGLTGLHGISYGNAMVAPMMCRDTEMPLMQGCLLINDYEVSACNGTIESLVSSINATTKNHGVIAVGREGEKLVLIDQIGCRIKIKVLHQAGSILSGFPCGSSRVEAVSNGLIVWLSFRHLNNLAFDSRQTAKLMSGDHELEVPLRSGMLATLSMHTPYEQKLTLCVLEIVKKTIDQEYNNITGLLEQFKVLIRSQKYLVDSDSAAIDKQ